MIDTGIRVAWLDVFAMVAAGAVVVLLVTAASLPGPVPHDASGGAANRVICPSVGTFYIFI